MRIKPELELRRVNVGALVSYPGDDFGCFVVVGPCNCDLRIIVSSGDPDMRWEHVSVSLPNRCPNWPEMCFVKDLFWDAEETVMQLHPPKSQWISNHPYCLHLWLPLDVEIPLPPDIAVGVQSAGVLTPRTALAMLQAGGPK
jgi:hypothetical protein